MAMRIIRSTVGVALTAIVLFTLGAVTSPAAQAAGCPDGGYTSTPGERIKGPNNATIYLVDPEGYKRRIVNAYTYEYFFRGWDGIVTRDDIGCIRTSIDISFPSSGLVHDGQGGYFFAEPFGSGTHYRWIVSGDVYQNKYYFRWDSATYTQPRTIVNNAGGWWG